MSQRHEFQISKRDYEFILQKTKPDPKEERKLIVLSSDELMQILTNKVLEFSNDTDLRLSLVKKNGAIYLDTIRNITPHVTISGYCSYCTRNPKCIYFFLIQNKPIGDFNHVNVTWYFQHEHSHEFQTQARGDLK